MASAQFGAKKYEEMKTTLVYGLITTLIFSLTITTPIYYFSDLICVSIGIELYVAELTKELLLMTLPMVYVINVGE